LKETGRDSALKLFKLLSRHKTSLLLLYAGLLLPIILLFYFFKPMVISGSSMYPTFHNNDHIVVDKFNGEMSTLKRGNVIVFFSPIGENRLLVKRIIGIQGDVIAIRNGSVFLNGKLLREPYTNHHSESFETIPAFRVPENSVFVLGDNRLVSADSREWGAVDKSRIYGKYVLKFKN